MGKIIIECPSCHHVHKISDECANCSQEREWVVASGGLACKSCHRGLASYPCDACGHSIPMIKDFAAYYADYQDCEGMLPAIVDELLGAQRYNDVLNVLNQPWVKYELPPAYPLAEKSGAASTQRSLWLIGAIIVGGVIGAFFGAMIMQSFGMWLGILGGIVLAAGFVWFGGGRMGLSNGKFIDAGLIALSGVLGVLALIVVIGGIIVWFVLGMLTDAVSS